jgi:hypothetical protein
MYKLKKITMYGTESFVILRENADGTITSFGEYPDNTDYQQFKSDIANGAELQDADGNGMSAQVITEFVATLP